MKIHSQFKDYEVNISHDTNFIATLAKDSNSFFAVDKKVYDLYCNTVLCCIPQNKIFLIEAEEQNKTMDTVLKICEKMTELPAKRNIHFVSIGGGIIQDITGLVANILYRGIDWTFVPTTLLSACDSCIGGKTSLNYKKFKNLLGTFYPPNEIYIIPEFFRTLSRNDYYSGLGEVVKFNVLHGEGTIKQLKKDINKLLNMDEDMLEKYVNNSLSFKKRFIEEDEFDKGIRIQLNFAHTFGHAIETTTNYEIPHGSAVAMGMVIANWISFNRGILKDSVVIDTESLVKKIIPNEYTECINKIDLKTIISAIKKDKKQTDSNIRAVLLDNSMQLLIVNDINECEIKEGFEHLDEILSDIDL